MLRPQSVSDQGASGRLSARARRAEFSGGSGQLHPEPRPPARPACEVPSPLSPAQALLGTQGRNAVPVAPVPRSSAGFRAPEGRARAPRRRFLPETPACVSCLLNHLIADRTFRYPNTSNDSEQARSAASAPSPPCDPGPPGPAPLPPARARLRGREGPCGARGGSSGPWGALGGSAEPCGAVRGAPCPGAPGARAEPPLPSAPRRAARGGGTGERGGAEGRRGARGGQGEGKERPRGQREREGEGKGRGRGEGEGSRRGHRESTGRGEVPRDPQHWGLFLAKETMGVPAGARGCWLCAPAGRGCTRGFCPGHLQHLGLGCADCW